MNFDLDQLIGELPELSPPPELKARVWAQLEQEMASPGGMSDSRSAGRAWIYPTLAVAAALVLMVLIPEGEIPGADGPLDPGPAVPESSEVEIPSGDLDAMTQKGAGRVIPSVELMMSVRSQGETMRLNRGETYGVGDELYFQAWVDLEADLALLRVDAETVELVHIQAFHAGRELLSLDGGAPLAWRIEAGEGSAVFALLAQPAGLETDALKWENVVEQLEGTYDLGHETGVCSALLGLDLRCSAQPVRVDP